MPENETPPPKWSEDLVDQLIKVLSHKNYEELRTAEILYYGEPKCSHGQCKNEVVWWFPIIGISHCEDHVSSKWKSMITVAWKGIKIELLLIYLIENGSIKE